MKPGIINIYTKFSNFGGAQNIAFLLHSNLSTGKINYLMGFNYFDNIHDKYPNIESEEYLKFSAKNIIRYKDFTFISHHRKITAYLKIISKIFFLDLSIIHVAHNEFYSLKRFSLFPSQIVAVSNKVKKNLINYFKIDRNRIRVIYNGLEDKFDNSNKSLNKKDIKILYPARIDGVKQQIKIVKNIKNKLNQYITIDFAGTGEDSERLSNLCENSLQFNYLGFINVDDKINEYDFVMLFSKNEGLPLSLIESCMHKTPILANDVGGNLEILENSYNGLELGNFNTLATDLNDLKSLSHDEYNKLSANARKIYQRRFSKEKMLKAYNNFLQE